PVSIPGVAAAGSGASLYANDGVVPGDLQAGDVAPDLPAQQQARLQAAVDDGAFPGAVCLVARHGKLLAEVAVGRHEYSPQAPLVTVDTLFDLASLTKVCATTPAILRLAALGKLSLDDPVHKWLPAFAGTGKDTVTIKHLLAHCGGLPAYERYYRTL